MNHNAKIEESCFNCSWLCQCPEGSWEYRCLKQDKEIKALDLDETGCEDFEMAEELKCED